ncbi:MAG: cytochrome b/b6 domain-containing protein [Planctomycetota bacterium]
MQRLEHKHPRPVRWMHWFNVVLLSGMIWSGLLIYWANDVYTIEIGGNTLFHFFPDWFYRVFSLRARLAEGMAWHFFFMWGFALNGLAYVAYTFLSGEWRYLVPNRQSFREAWRVMLHDLHLSKVEPPKRKFNGAQQFAYTGVILMGAVVADRSGDLQAGQFHWLTMLFGGYPTARFAHFAPHYRLRPFLSGAHLTGHPCRLEQLSRDDLRL